VLFALVVLPIVLLVGLEGVEPVVGDPVKGTPAWHARLEPGAPVTAVNGRDPFDFMGLRTEIALSGKGPVVLDLYEPETGAVQQVTIQPVYDENQGVYQVGISAPADPEGRLRVQKDGPAERAGVRAGDVLLGVPGQPEWLSPREQLERALMGGDDLALRVAGADGVAREVTIVPEVTYRKGTRIAGIQPIPNVVEDLRLGPGGAPGPAQRLGLVVGDRVVSVAGRVLLHRADFLDALAAADGPFDVVVERDGQRATLSSPAQDLATKRALEEDVFLVQDTASNRVTVQQGRPAALAGVVNGDRIVSVNGTLTSTWDEVFEHVRAAAGRLEPMALEVWRDREPASGVEGAVAGDGAPRSDAARHTTHLFTLEAEPARELAYGLELENRSAVQRAGSFPEALSMGATASWRFLANTWLTLKKMLFTQEVSTKNLGGIITISVVSFHTASEGLTQLFFLLAIISVNLAILNILPIPILDGGHLLFLLVEWVKGSPVSERTLGYSQVVGLVLLLSLMIYVTYQDVVRWILPG
jgi:regulator of sigma E protease